jgi:predicted PurR-regulated permease PerM
VIVTGNNTVNFGEWLGLIALTTALYILWQIRQLLLLVFTAVVLATALNRLAQMFQQLRLQRGVSVVLAIGVMFAFFTLVVSLIVPPFTHEFQELTRLVPQGLERVNQWIDASRANVPNQWLTSLPDLDMLMQQAQPLANRFLGGSLTFVSNSLNFVLNFLFMLVLTIMFLVDPKAYRRGFIRLFPAFYRPRVSDVLDQCEASLGGWMVGALISMVIISVLSGIGLALLRVKLALANAILAGLLNFIPNIGPAFSVVPPMAIALLDSSWKTIAVLVLYFGIQQFESTLLTPYIMAQQVSLLPAITLLSQVFFATIFGFFGLVMALPLTVVGKVLLREALIKDVLDRWHPSSETSLAPETAILATAEDSTDALSAHPPPTAAPDQSASLSVAASIHPEVKD